MMNDHACELTSKGYEQKLKKKVKGEFNTQKKAINHQTRWYKPFEGKKTTRFNILLFENNIQ